MENACTGNTKAEVGERLIFLLGGIFEDVEVKKTNREKAKTLFGLGNFRWEEGVSGRD